MEGPYFSDVRVFMMLASPRNKLQVRLPRSVRGGVRKLYLKIGKSQGGTPPPPYLRMFTVYQGAIFLKPFLHA